MVVGFWRGDDLKSVEHDKGLKLQYLLWWICFVFLFSRW